MTGHEERHDPGTFNIWTGRKLREFRAPREQGAPREPSKYRCMPKLDSGWTRGEGMNVSYCCLYFARCVSCCCLSSARCGAAGG